MKKMLNSEDIIGKIYQHNLQIKIGQTAGKATYGKEYITGDLSIAVDKEGLNVITVRYPCVMEYFTSGSLNRSFPVLKKIIEENKTWLDSGKEEAPTVHAQPSIALRDFYDDQEQLVSYKINEGGFISFWTKHEIPKNKTNNFTADMLITSIAQVEPEVKDGEDPEQEYVKIKGAVFNYKGELLPTDFVVRTQEGMDYFLDMDVSSSEPALLKLFGEIISKTVKKEVKEELAFGGTVSYTREKSVKEWEVTGVFNAGYEFGEQGILTAEEVKKAMQDREIKLAEEKARSAAWKAQKAAGASQTPPIMGISNNDIPAGSFKFDY